MAHHKSAKKRIRQIQKRRLHNRYYKKTTSNMMRRLDAAEADEAKEKLPLTISMIDKLAKIGVFHKNKAANIKSKLTKRVNAKIAAK
ncbi:MAG: 30S ribosomal protein S20 [Chitinophagaceae bacterium]|nr:MAG: 30S ribosomal protein S20 [Chitinophagaceae bacterium]